VVVISETTANLLRTSDTSHDHGVAVPGKDQVHTMKVTAGQDDFPRPVPDEGLRAASAQDPVTHADPNEADQEPGAAARCARAGWR